MLRINNFFILLTIISIIIIIGVVIYAIIYNKNANRALRSGKPNILLDKGPFINMLSIMCILVLSIVLVFQMIKQKDTINELDNKITQLDQDIANLRRSISSLESQFIVFVESQKNVYNQDYELGDVNTEEKKINVSITFSLREVSLNSKITIKATNKDDLDDIVTVIANGTGTYEANLLLSVNGNYSIIIVDETTDTIKTYELMHIYLKNMFKQYFKTFIEYNSNNKLMLNIIADQNINLEVFNLTDILLEVKDDNNNIIYNQSIFELLNKSDDGYNLEVDNILTLDNYTTYSFTIKLYNQFGEIDRFDHTVKPIK